MEKLALYLHIPFCARRCAYCHFDIKVLHPRTPANAVYQTFTDLLCREIASRARQYPNREVSSIFFGGGTPSRLPLKEHRQILKNLGEQFQLAPHCEINMELNPEDVDETYLQGLLELGINRISFGVQTFDAQGLQAIGRLHSPQQAMEALRLGQGFPKGVSMDLILGLPYQTQKTLESDLQTIAELGPQHVSLYMLERDLPTTLDKIAHRLPMPDEDTQATFYETVCQRLADLGYQHYELSNWAKEGYDCKHNQVYWQCGDYLGFGPAAVGRVGLKLEANHARLQDWQAAVAENGLGTDHVEDWQPARFQQERLIQGLRLRKGVPNSWLNEAQWSRLQLAMEHGLLKKTEDRLALTQKGCLLGNEVFESLVEDE